MSENVLKQQLKVQLQATGVEADESGAGRVASPGVWSRASRVEVAGFLRELAVLASGNYPLVRALRVLARTVSNANLSATVADIASQVESGAPLSKAMARYPWYFDTITVSTLKAAETSANLEEALNYLAEMMEYDQEIRDRIGNALAYPFVLSLLSAAVILMLMVFVVPNFAAYITEAGGEVTGLAAVIYGVSAFVSTPYGLPIVLAVLGGAAWGLVRWRRRNEASFNRLMGYVPIFGRLMMLASLARFVNMLHILTANHVSLLQCLDLARGAVGNAYLTSAINDMYASAESGKSLAEPLKKYTNIPPVVADMIAVGEESGRLDEMLGFLARAVQADLNRITNRLTVLIQPLMLILMGGIVIAVTLAFFYPYFEVLTALSKIR